MPASADSPCPAPAPETSAQYDSTTGCLTHVFWMFIGNAVLFILAALIYQQPSWPPTWLDALYALTVLLLIVARWIDTSVFHGTSASGEPGTIIQVRTYAVGLILLTALVWGGVHLLPRPGG